ncbi:MAG: hypothetical protein ABI867_05105 [Kofleriaceae bacterium]
MKLLLIALVVIAAVRPAVACDCETPSARVAYFRSDAVFTGKVTKRTQRHVTVAIDQRFRGAPAGATVEIHGGGMCDLELTVGKTYFVYAKRIDGVLVTGLCSRTGLLADAKADLAFARDPK